MKYVLSILTGCAAAGAAVLLHLQLPPWGIALALVGSMSSIWAVVRKSGARRFGFVAALAWIAVTWRAALPGVGGELLVQGDLPGEVLVLVGTGLVAITAFISHPQ